MLKPQLRTLIVATTLFLAAPLSYADPFSAFDFFKSMAGTWSIHDNGSRLPLKMTYDIHSRNTVVTEQFGKELSVFSIDESELVMTHFCNRGNQPWLKLVADRANAIFEFEMFEISNLENPDDPHVQRIIYKVIDPTHVDLELIWKIGNLEPSERYSLTKD